MNNEIKLFEGNQIRSIWDNEQEEWYFSVVDIVGALTDSKNPRDYWYRVKKRMTEEEKSQLSTICRQLKLESSDGKMYNTDVADMQGTMLRTCKGYSVSFNLCHLRKPNRLRCGWLKSEKNAWMRS